MELYKEQNLTTDNAYRKVLAIKAFYHALSNEFERSLSIREFLRSLAEKDEEFKTELPLIGTDPLADDRVIQKRSKIARDSLYYAITQEEEKANALRFYLRSMAPVEK